MATISKGHFVSAPYNHGKNGFYNNLSQENWYRAYTKIWDLLKFKFEQAIEELSMSLVKGVVEYVLTHQYMGTNIPLVTVSSDLNSDNLSRVSKELQSRSVNVYTVSDANITSMNYFIHRIVSSFLNCDNENSSDEETENEENINYSKSCRMTLRHLFVWYKKAEKNLDDNSLPQKFVIIFPNIESFPGKMLKKFLQAVNVYAGRLPLVLVFGVMCGLDIVFSTISITIVSQFSIRSFKSPPAAVFFNSVLEKVFLTADCPFQISGKILEFLTNSFLTQHFSVDEFIRGIQYCLMNQFFDSDISVLCCPCEDIPDVVKSLKVTQRKKVSALTSVKKARRTGKIPDKEILDIKVIEKLLKKFHDHLSLFHVAVRCLHAFVKDLPNHPLGNNVQGIYIEAMNTDICKNSDEFKSCLDILQHLSKGEILEKLDTIIKILKTNKRSQFNVILDKLYNHRKILQESNLCKTVESPVKSSQEIVPLNRFDFMKALSLSATEGRKQSQFSVARSDFLKFLSAEFLKKCLVPPSDLPLSEIMVFSDLSMVRVSFSAFPRAALHHAMVSPCSYLLCKCCVSADKNAILSSFPDLCIVYKLHLECGHHINLYDWLQSFNSIVDEDNNGDVDETIKPEIHARFMQAVKELEFLGYIAPSTHKVDHVKKLIF